MQRESATVTAMVRIYCRDQHKLSIDDCESCDELHRYAQERLDRCPFGEGKTTCKNCPVHCYKPSMKEEVRQVMRYAGPRMILRHPILTIYHFIDERRKEPLSSLSALKEDTPDVEESCEGDSKFPVD